ncbi:MAG: hypothetical protein NZM12_04280 [Steroidobacteraceae bacterium]|nr:hypothetical protein [Steroidobacteraceae bacterium]
MGMLFGGLSSNQAARLARVAVAIVLTGCTLTCGIFASPVATAGPNCVTREILVHFGSKPVFRVREAREGFVALPAGDVQATEAFYLPLNFHANLLDAVPGILQKVFEQMMSPGSVFTAAVSYPLGVEPSDGIMLQELDNVSVRSVELLFDVQRPFSHGVIASIDVTGKPLKRSVSTAGRWCTRVGSPITFHQWNFSIPGLQNSQADPTILRIDRLRVESTGSKGLRILPLVLTVRADRADYFYAWANDWQAGRRVERDGQISIEPYFDDALGRRHLYPKGRIVLIGLGLSSISSAPLAEPASDGNILLPATIRVALTVRAIQPDVATLGALLGMF